MPLDVPAISFHMITSVVLAGIAYFAGYIVLKLTRNNNPSKVKAYATVGFVGAFFSFGWFFGWESTMTLFSDCEFEGSQRVSSLL